MSILLPALGVAFVALCVWLGVRIINRRERWAKRTAVGLVVGLPFLYVLSFGPACWLADRGWFNDWESLRVVYWPIHKTACHLPKPVDLALLFFLASHRLHGRAGVRESSGSGRHGEISIVRSSSVRVTRQNSSRGARMTTLRRH